MLDKQLLTDKFNLFLNNFIDHIPLIVLSIIIFIIFYIIAEYYKTNVIDFKKSKNSFYSEQENETSTSLIYHELSWMTYYSIIIFGLIVSLVNIGFNVATIITLLGTVGLALSLSLQETLKNMISGIYIGINKLFNIGDIIILKPFINVNTTIGKIIDFNLYYTTLLDSNNQISMVPNSLIQNNILTNLTLSKKMFNNI